MTVTERFLKYVSFHTTSDESSETIPSTDRQRTFGAFLVEEMTALGLQDARMDDHGYVYAYLPSNIEGCSDAVGYIAHMDTSPDVSGENVKPEIVTYGGGDIPLKGEGVISAEKFPFLAKYVGEQLIVTDGTTLLGADDKAGIAEIVTACEYFLSHPEIPHKAIALGFTPDEEIGRGADCFDVYAFPASYAYTVDGGEVGEIEYENFNAASAHVAFKGINIHPGSAKNKMRNAALIAAEFVSLLPAEQTPAHTEGYEGFYHLHHMSGCESSAEVAFIVRDHDRAKFEAKKAYLAGIASLLQAKYGEDALTLTVKDSYYNMKEQILPHMYLITEAEAAMRQAGVEPKIVAIRGGTDGARLSYMGLPCPNLSTGGYNFHGVHELIPVQSMEKMVQVLVNLAAPRA